MTHLNPPSRGALEPVSRALRVFLRSIFGRLLVLALAAWGAFNLWNWVTAESVAEMQAADTSSSIKVEGLKSFVVRKDGQKHWKVVADSAQLVDNNDAWLAKGVSNATLFRDEQPWIVMRAPRVRYSNLSRNLDAVGGVTARGPERFSFSTPQARWLEQKKLVEIPGAVRARLRDMEFSAPNLTYQWEKGLLSCPDRVEVRVEGGVLRGARFTTDINTRVVKMGRDVELIFVPGVAKAPQPFASATAQPANYGPLADNSAKARPFIMPRSRSLPTALTLAMATMPTALLVQAPVAPVAKAAPSAKTAGSVVINAGGSSYDDSSKVYTLNGGVTMTEVGKEFALTASNVIYNQPADQASASGNLKVETRSSTIRGAKLFGDFNRKLLSISGNVVISAYDKGNGMSGFRSSVARKPVRIACNRLDWNYATRQATLVGNLRIVQADNSGTCDTIVYDEPKNTVYLKGNVRFGNAKGQQFIGDEVVIYVDRGLVNAPNVTIRSGMDAPTPSVKKNAPAPKPPIVFPGQNVAPATANATLPQAPPPIESLVPKSTPFVRVKPTLPPLPKEKAAPEVKAEDKSDAEDKEKKEVVE